MKRPKEKGWARLEAGLLAPPTVQGTHSGLRFAMASFGPCSGLVLCPVRHSAVGLEAFFCCCCCRASCMDQMLSGRM